MKYHALHKLSIFLFFAACSSDEPRTFSTPDSGDLDDATIIDAGSDTNDTSTLDVTEIHDVGTDLGSNICRPNLDGVITRQEVPIDAGLSARFRVATDVTFDTTGTGGPDFLWDLEQDLPGDSDTLVALNRPAGTWWETTFLTATYYTSLSTTSDLLGVFEVTDDSLLLLGVVSPEDGVLATELTYDPPIPVLQFPLSPDDRWSVESSVSGRFNGVFSLWTEDYVFEVDKTGTLASPFADFDVMRIRSVLSRQVGILTTTVRSFSFVSECFGTVASISAQDDETELEFTDVKELRRLTR